MTMTEDATALDLRALIMAEPALILEDQELMRALVRADGRTSGRNVVDLRSVLVERLEERLDRLEDTHREVLAAAYDNVAGTNQVHRACLALLDANDFAAFLRAMTRDIAGILGVDVVRLGLEAPGAEPGAGLGPAGPLQDVVVALPGGGVDADITLGRGIGSRTVTLRRLDGAAAELYGAHAPRILSEAVLRLDLGEGNRAGVLGFGAFDRDRFHADQGTDLLGFFAGVFERSLRRFLA
jgi:uncharacterized protein YigA (DUF484 family)